MKKRYFRQAAFFLASAFFWHMPAGSCAALSLDEAVDMALKQNTSIQITRLGEDSAAAALRQAKGAKGFTITASSSLDLSKTNGEDRSTLNANSITANLPVYTGGKAEANIDSSELGVRIAKLQTARECENIRLSVIQAYYNVLEAQKNIRVDQESVDNYQAHLTNVQQLFSAGSKARVDVLRASVALSNSRQTLIKAQNSYEVALSTLRNIIDLGRDEPLTLTQDFVYEPFHDTMDSCLSYALTNRKDLLVDQYTVEQKNLAVKSAKAGLLPTVSVAVGTNLSQHFEPSSTSNSGYTAGVSASWDVFDSGITHAKIDSAKTDEAVAKLNLQKAQNDVDLAVRTAYYNMKEAEKRFTSTQDAVNQAEEDYYIASEKYRAGEGVMLDIIDAQLALSTAQLNFISAQYDYARYKAEVENTMGLDVPVSMQAADNTAAAGKAAEVPSDQSAGQPAASAVVPAAGADTQAAISLPDSAIHNAADVDAADEGLASDAVSHEIVDEAAANGVDE